MSGAIFLRLRGFLVGRIVVAMCGSIKHNEKGGLLGAGGRRDYP
jgi:hypothetical protein